MIMPKNPPEMKHYKLLMFRTINLLLRVRNQSASSEKDQGYDEARARRADIPDHFHCVFFSVWPL